MTWFSKVRNSDTLKRLTKHLHIIGLKMSFVMDTTIRTISDSMVAVKGFKCWVYYWWTWRINSKWHLNTTTQGIVFRRRKSINCDLQRKDRYKYKFKATTSKMYDVELFVIDWTNKWEGRMSILKKKK